MDEAVIKHYRRLLREDFPNAGALEQPCVLVRAVGGKLINCGNTGNYMELYLRVTAGRIEDIRYLCACEPTANVAVEILCGLARGLSLEEAPRLSVEQLQVALGSSDPQFSEKARGLLGLLDEAMAGYRADTGAQAPCDGDEQGPQFSWDGALSN